MMGMDIFCGTDASTLSDIFAIAHPVGKMALSAFGAGGLADVVAPLEQQGIQSTMSPDERAAAQAKQQAAVAAKQQAAVVQQQQAAAVAKAPSKWRWALYAAGAALVVVIVVMLRGRRS